MKHAMEINMNRLMKLLLLLLALAWTAIWATPAYADDGADGAGQAPAGEEAPPPADPVVDTPSEDLSTPVIVLDESGQALPLASEQAAQTLVTGDPVWCPATLAAPTPGLNGCTNAYTSMTALINELVNPGGLVTNPGMDGIIWVASNYDKTQDSAALVFSGTTLNVMTNFNLTIQGGWCDGSDLTCMGLIDPTKPSVFDDRLYINNWIGNITLKNLQFTGVSAGGFAGLEIATNGNITLDNVQVTSTASGGTGAFLNSHNAGAGTGDVTVTNAVFSSNGNYGLYIVSNGAVNLANITAQSNTFIGVYIKNDNNPATPKPVTVSGTNLFNNNGSIGLYILAKGAVSLNNITASGSTGGSGVQVDNTLVQGAGVTLTGINTFSGNNSHGLYVASNGAIKAGVIIAVGNGSSGVSFYNNTAAAAQPVTMTGPLIAKYNVANGLNIQSKGVVTLANVDASGNGGTHGASIANYYDTAVNIALTGVNKFDNNTAGSGLLVLSKGAVSLSNVSANNNGAYGIYLENDYGTGSITLSGSVSASNNTSRGVYLQTKGAVTITSLTANDNDEYGLQCNCNANLMPFSLLGVNQISGNDFAGLSITTQGAVTINSLTASNNGASGSGDGAYINNSISSLPQPVTLTGVNVFNNNKNSGLYVLSNGVIKTNSLTASLNQLNYGVYLNNTSSTTAAGVAMSGINTMVGNYLNNLSIASLGAISANSLTASASVTGNGAYLSNNSAADTPAKGVTLTGVNTFNFNASGGLVILTKGAITISNLTASGNGDSFGESGASLDNSASTVNSPITLTGYATLQGNYHSGLQAYSCGAVKIANLTVTDSSTYIGAYIYNQCSGATGAVTLSGVNTISNNTNNSGLEIYSHGPLLVSNLTASDNGNYGAYLSNSTNSAAPKPVTLTGTNKFIGNTFQGLRVATYGAITISNLTASDNNSYGASLSNGGGSIPAAVTLTGSNTFNDNASTGLEVYSLGVIKISNTSASDNNGNGVYLRNSDSSAAVGVTLSGFGLFVDNNGDGLRIDSTGVVSTMNITARDNVNIGLTISNTANPAAPKGVTLGGTNTFTGNGTGLSIISYGLITTNNITALDNLFNNVVINNDAAAAPAGVVMNGLNLFKNSGGYGLSIDSTGPVTINAPTANDNLSGGLYIANTYGSYPSSFVLIKGVATVNGNGGLGLNILSYGKVTTNGIIANENDSLGASIQNSGSGVSGNPVTLNGVNQFNGNSESGLFIRSNGVVATNNITANGNGVGVFGGSGVMIDLDDNATFFGALTMKGTNTFNGNKNYGLYVSGLSHITLNNVTVIGTTMYDGAYIYNGLGSGNVTLTGLNNFIAADDNGLEIFTNGIVSITKLAVEGNGMSGAAIFGVGKVTITCGSAITNNNTGIYISVTDPITLIGVAAAGNSLDYDFSGNPSVTQTYGCPLP